MRHKEVIYFFQKDKVNGRAKNYAPNSKLILPLHPYIELKKKKNQKTKNKLQQILPERRKWGNLS